MSYVTIIWSMVASACLTLAAIHLLSWCRKRTAWDRLLFSLTALATAAMAFCELWMMWAETPGQFGTALRWYHVPAWVAVLTLVGFLHFHLRAGRPWLAWTICVLRTVSLLLNFLVEVNLNYREVTHLWRIPFLGESVSVAEGVANPWALAGILSLLLLTAYVIDAAITVWRQGNRRLALVVSGSIVLFVIAAIVQAVLVLLQAVHTPVMISVFFMGTVALMAMELGRETILAGQLMDALRESEARMTLATEATGVGVWQWSIARNQVWGSEKWLGLFGFATDEAITLEKVIRQIHPDDREMVERGVRRAMEDEGDYTGEFRAVLPDGSERWVAARGLVYPDAKGKPSRMLGTAVDITNRKQTEETLREQVRFEALLTDLSSEFINVPSDKVDHQIEDAQRRVCECMGLDLSSLWQWPAESRRDLELTHIYCPPDFPQLPESMKGSESFPWCLQQVLAGRTVAVSSLEELPAEAARDKETYRQLGILTALTMPLSAGAGPTIGALSFNTTRAERTWPEAIVMRLQIVAHVVANAIARKRADGALGESVARLQLATEAAGAGLWVMDPNGGSVWASAKTRELFQFGPDQPLAYQDFIERINPDDRDMVDRAVREAISVGRGFAVEYRVSRPDGQPRWIVARGNLWGPPGGPQHCMGVSVDITDRRQVEENLRASVERFRQVAETAGEFIWEVNAEGLYTYASPSVEKILGYAPDELAGKKHFFDLFAPSVREELKAAALRVFAERQAFRDFSNPNVSKSGKVVHLETSGAPMLDAEGNLVGYRGADTDVSDRKQRDEALRASEARCASAVDVAELGFYEVADGNQAVFLDNRGQALIGVRLEHDRDAVAFQFWAEHLHPEDGPRIMDANRRLNEGALDRITVDYRYQHPQRGQIWIHHLAHVLDRNAAGQAVRTIGVMCDVTEQKQAVEQLRESDELNRATFEQAAVGIAHVGTDGRWLRVNDRLCAILGYTREELLKLTFQDITYPDDLHSDLECMRQVLAGEMKTYSAENRYVRKDRSIVCTYLTVSLVRTVAGEPRHFISVVQDISDRKHAELEAQRTRAEIAHLSRVAMLGELSGSLAHELNQPLAAILSNAQAAQRFLADESVDLDETRDILKDIVADDQRAGEVIRRLRLLLKKGDVQHLPLDINEVVEDVLKMTRNDLMNHSISLRRVFAPDLAVVTGDRVQLQQVVLNLIGNATDAMAHVPPMKRQLLIRTDCTREGGVRVAVADQGSGLAPNVLANLFTPFFSTKSAGMGLGLRVCRTIIAAHGGSIDAENNSEGGATFHFTLPAAKKEHP